MLTKWAAVGFIGLALLLSVLNSATGKKKSSSGVREALEKQAASAPVVPAVPAANSILTAPAVTNVVPAFGAPEAVASTGMVETITTITNAATNAPGLLETVIKAATNEAAKATETLKKEVEAATKQ